MKFSWTVLWFALSIQGCGEAPDAASQLDIVDGELVDGMNHPVAGATIALKRGSKIFCSATLIGPNHLVSAAHCFQQGGRVKAGFGAQGNVGSFVLQDIIVHPDFIMGQHSGGPGGPFPPGPGGPFPPGGPGGPFPPAPDGPFPPDSPFPGPGGPGGPFPPGGEGNRNEPPHDIAIAVFSGELPGDVHPVVVASSPVAYDDEVVLAGYGVTGERRQDGGRLRYVESIVAKVNARANEFILARNGRGACYGDSGGPAFVATVDGLQVVGATSRGSGGRCESGGAIYTDISRYRRWMKCAFTDAGYPLDGLADAGGRC